MAIALVCIVIYISIFPQLLIFYDWAHGIYESFRAVYLTLFSYIVRRQTLFVILLILSPLILYPIRKLKQAVYNKIDKRKVRIQNIKSEDEQIQQLLKVDADELDIDEMKTFIRNLHDKIELSRKIKKFTRFEKLLLAQMEDARTKLRALKYKAKVDELDFKKEKVRLEIENLKKEKKREESREQWRLWEVESNLHIKKRNAFLRSVLNYEEINILHHNGYEDANEYDIIKRKIVPVLVKKIMNHTHTHTFLVWSVEAFLERFDQVKYLQHHDTRYPDINFTVDDLDYALEIETGPLLRKKRQAAAKVAFLNKHYPGRWMFIVSNKNLVSKYRKLGPSTQRSEVEKNIKEMLENSL